MPFGGTGLRGTLKYATKNDEWGEFWKGGDQWKRFWMNKDVLRSYTGLKNKGLGKIPKLANSQTEGSVSGVTEYSDTAFNNLVSALGSVGSRALDFLAPYKFFENIAETFDRTGGRPMAPGALQMWYTRNDGSYTVHGGAAAMKALNDGKYVDFVEDDGDVYDHPVTPANAARLQSHYNSFRKRFGPGKKTHPSYAYANGNLFYDAMTDSSRIGRHEVPSFAKMKQFVKGSLGSNSFVIDSLTWNDDNHPKFWEQIFPIASDAGVEFDFEDKINALVKSMGPYGKAPGLIGKSFFPVTSPNDVFAGLMKDLFQTDSTMKDAALGIVDAMGNQAMQLDAAWPQIGDFDDWWANHSTPIFAHDVDDTVKGIANSAFGFDPFSPLVGLLQGRSGWAQLDTLTNQRYSSGMWIAEWAEFRDALQKDGVFSKVNFENEEEVFNAKKEIAKRLDAFSTAVEGKGDWAMEMAADAKIKVKNEKEDAKVEEQAIEEEAKRVQAKNLAVFYGNNAQKAAAMEKVLKKDPTVAGAPWPVWRIPPYAQGNIDPEGVFNQKTEKNISPPFVVAALKRSGQNFDALFTYFRDMSFDLRGLAGSGIVTGAGADGKLVYDVNKMVDADNLGDKTKAALARWSNSTADQWYPFDAEQMALIRIFFGKNLEKGLTNIQSDTRDAIADASIIF